MQYIKDSQEYRRERDNAIENAYDRGWADAVEEMSDICKPKPKKTIDDTMTQNSLFGD